MVILAIRLGSLYGFGQGMRIDRAYLDATLFIVAMVGAAAAHRLFASIGIGYLLPGGLDVTT